MLAERVRNTKVVQIPAANECDMPKENKICKPAYLEIAAFAGSTRVQHGPACLQAQALDTHRPIIRLIIKIFLKRSSQSKFQTQ